MKTAASRVLACESQDYKMHRPVERTLRRRPLPGSSPPPDECLSKPIHPGGPGAPGGGARCGRWRNELCKRLIPPVAAVAPEMNYAKRLIPRHRRDRRRRSSSSAPSGTPAPAAASWGVRAPWPVRPLPSRGGAAGRARSPKAARRTCVPGDRRLTGGTRRDRPVATWGPQESATRVKPRAAPGGRRRSPPLLSQTTNK